MSKVEILSLSIAYYHNISFVIAPEGCVLAFFFGVEVRTKGPVAQLSRPLEP